MNRYPQARRRVREPARVFATPQARGLACGLEMDKSSCSRTFLLAVSRAIYQWFPVHGAFTMKNSRFRREGLPCLAAELFTWALPSWCAPA